MQSWTKSSVLDIVLLRYKWWDFYSYGVSVLQLN